MPPSERYTVDLWNLLQQPGTLDRIGANILNGGPRAIRYREGRTGGKSIVFVAHHEDVVSVLTDEDSYSLCHYDPLYAAVAPPGAFIVMRPDDSKRTMRLAILLAAAAETPWFEEDSAARRALARECVDNILSAIRRRGRPFDLIGEYGFFAPYLIAKRVIGLTPPQTFSLLPLAVCLMNGHPLSQLFAPETGPYLTDLAWSEVVVAQLLGNFENRNVFIRLGALWGATRLRRQIERYVDQFPRDAGDQTLLTALWAVRDSFHQVGKDDYREHVVSIVMELASTIMIVPGLGFAGIVNRWQKGGPGLHESLLRLEESRAEDFVQEELRFAPPAAKLLRNATAPVELGGLSVKEGEYVCALVKSAGLDIPDQPREVRLGRSPDTYLHFGPEGGPHRCFGHRLAPSMLAEMFLGLQHLPNFAPRSGSTDSQLVPGRLMVDFDEQVGTGL